MGLETTIIGKLNIKSIQDRDCAKVIWFLPTSVFFHHTATMAKGYDREVDEGKSFIDTTAIIDFGLHPEDEVRKMCNKLSNHSEELHNKWTYITGFALKKRQYVALSMECHKMNENDAKMALVDFAIQTIRGSIPAELLHPNDIARMPALPLYASVNLGEYGSTGCPAYRIQMHPDAARLRSEGLIK